MNGDSPALSARQRFCLKSSFNSGSRDARYGRGITVWPAGGGKGCRAASQRSPRVQGRCPALPQAPALRQVPRMLTRPSFQPTGPGPPPMCLYSHAQVLSVTGAMVRLKPLGQLQHSPPFLGSQRLPAPQGGAVFVCANQAPGKPFGPVVVAWHFLKALHRVATRAAVALAVHDVPELASWAVGAEPAGALVVLVDALEVGPGYLLAGLVGVDREDGPRGPGRAGAAGAAPDQVEGLPGRTEAAVLLADEPGFAPGAGRLALLAAVLVPATGQGRCGEGDPDPQGDPTSPDPHLDLPAFGARSPGTSRRQPRAAAEVHP